MTMRSRKGFARACLAWCLLGWIGAIHAAEPDYAGHVDKLRQRLDTDTFTILVEKPFVVIGDESPDRVRQRALRTVRWAVEKLKADYFEKDPPYIIDIWLFKDRESYEHHARTFFGDKPDTPYGYYSPRHRALVMNIATGGGTLVHEIVHPFVAANFPKCPAWFNEGLGSLYEQAAERDGRIIGLTNWRLAGLQQAIADGRTLPLDQLMGTTTAEFYGEGSGLHYAMARYLCFYLQEHGGLREFYHAFADDADRDPTGQATLRKVLKHDDLPAFQTRWETWVQTLRFP